MFMERLFFFKIDCSFFFASHRIKAKKKQPTLIIISICCIGYIRICALTTFTIGRTMETLNTLEDGTYFKETIKRRPVLAESVRDLARGYKTFFMLNSA